MKLLAKNKNYTLLWAGQLVSQTGDRFYQLAMFWWILQSGGSLATMGGVMAVAAVPAVLCAPFFGALVDRASKKWIMAGTDAARGLVLLFMSHLAQTDLLEVWHLYLFALILAMLGALFNPAVMSGIPAIVEEEDIQEAMALHSLTANLSTFIGPALGGVAVAAWGIPAALLAGAVSFICSSISEMFIFMPTIHMEHDPVFAAIKSGLGWVKKQTVLFRMLLSFGLLNYFLIPVTIIVPAFAKNVLQGDADTAGLLSGAIGAGSLVAAALLSRWKLKFTVRTQLVWSVMALGLSLLVFGSSNAVWAALASMVVFGFHLGLLNISLIVAFQKMVPTSLKGRFFALLDAMSFGLFPLSYASVGPAEAVMGIRGVLYLGGAVSILTALYYLRLLASAGDFLETGNPD